MFLRAFLGLSASLPSLLHFCVELMDHAISFVLTKGLCRTKNEVEQESDDRKDGNKDNDQSDQPEGMRTTEHVPCGIENREHYHRGKQDQCDLNRPQNRIRREEEEDGVEEGGERHCDEVREVWKKLDPTSPVGFAGQEGLKGKVRKYSEVPDVLIFRYSFLVFSYSRTLLKDEDASDGGR